MFGHYNLIRNSEWTDKHAMTIIFVWHDTTPRHDTNTHHTNTQQPLHTNQYASYYYMHHTTLLNTINQHNNEGTAKRYHPSKHRSKMSPSTGFTEHIQKPTHQNKFKILKPIQQNDNKHRIYSNKHLKMHLSKCPPSSIWIRILRSSRHAKQWIVLNSSWIKSSWCLVQIHHYICKG